MAKQEHLIKRLKKLFKTFKEQPTSEQLEAYIESLSDLTDGEIDIAFIEAIKRCKFRPQPAEIREALTTARECRTGTRFSLADPNCERCGGTGYGTVPARDPDTHEEIPGYRWAVRCQCTKRNAAD